MEAVVKKYLEQLALLRVNKLGLESFTYSERRNEEGAFYDANSINRYRLLIALQLERRDDDDVLLRFLFNQEILAHQRADFQGVFNSIKLNAFLLARFNCVDDLPLFIAACSANFDTQFEFNSKYFLWNGLQVSFDFVMCLDSDSKEFFYSKVGDSLLNCVYTDDEMERWKIGMQQLYPIGLSFEDFEEEFYFLLDLNEDAAARSLLDEWKLTNGVQDKNYWKDLVRYYKYLGDELEKNKAVKELNKIENV